MRQHYRWDKKRGDWVVIPPRSAPSGPLLVRDTASYRNVIDGKEIDGRTAHREFLKRNNVVEIGNDPVGQRKQAPSYAEQKDLRNDIGKAYNMVDNGYRPDRPMSESDFRNIH